MSEPSPPRRGQSQGASSVASYVGDDRDAWSCPLPNEIFEVGSQGQDEDIAALGVAIALRNHHAWCTPVRHASQTLDSPSTFLAALTFLCCPLGRDGSLPSSTRRSCRSQGSGHLFLRSHSPISTLSLSNLRRGCCFNSLRYWSLASACPSPRSSWRIVWSVHTPQPHHSQPTIRNLTPLT